MNAKHQHNNNTTDGSKKTTTTTASSSNNNNNNNNNNKEKISSSSPPQTPIHLPPSSPTQSVKKVVADNEPKLEYSFIKCKLNNHAPESEPEPAEHENEM